MTPDERDEWLGELWRIIQSSGLRPSVAGIHKLPTNLTASEYHLWMVESLKVLVADWTSRRPARAAVRALSDDQRQTLADDRRHMADKVRPLFADRARLLSALGRLPEGFEKSGALDYREAWDAKLASVGTIEPWKFDDLVEALPRLRLNASVDTLTKLSKVTRLSRNTLRRYARLVDLSRWVGGAEGGVDA